MAESVDPKKVTLPQLYKSLSPIGTLEPKDVDVVNFHDVLKDMCLDPRGKYYAWDAVKAGVDAYFKKASDDKVADASSYFHAVSTTGVLDMRDADYWRGVKRMADVVPTLNNKESKTVVSAFVCRNPYVNPSTRGTDNIDFFLNYTPALAANQLMPYLDVEFEILRPHRSNEKDSMNSLASPSILRFLLGSKPVKDMSSSDFAINKASYFIDKQAKSKDGNFDTIHAFSGMEMFLAPQTLTNMDELGPTANRLVRVKPFVPFASIESFTITTQNAGAGAFAHKKGVLKMKIHDKARMSEMAEFFKGSSGFNQAVVWTTYGWLAPMNRGDEDEYASFINDNMLIRECWQVSNTQFSFADHGAVDVSIEMLTKAAKDLQSITVVHGRGLTKEMQSLSDAMEVIADAKAKLSSNPRFSITVATDQVISAAATNGNFADLKDVDGAIQNFLTTAGGFMAKDDWEKLNSALKTVKSNKYDAIKKDAAATVSRMFNDLKTDAAHPDPFLAPDGASNHFPDPELANQLRQFNKGSDARVAAITSELAKSKDKATSPLPAIDQAARVVSFGKLFLNFVVPSILSMKACDELEVFFYNLNDQCGPVSGLSVAEFPIDVVKLSYEYAEAVKAARTEALTLTQFMRLVANSQFSDVRSPGFGMNSFYDVWNPASAEAKVKDKNPEAERGLAAWASKYGTLRLPMLEVYIETGQNKTSSKSVVSSLKKSALTSRNGPTPVGLDTDSSIIKRIHIYDKQSNPYALMQNVFDGGDSKNLIVGNIDRGKVEARLRQAIKNDKKVAKKIQEALDAGKSYDEALKAADVPPPSMNRTDVAQMPGGKVWEVPRDRESFKNQLSRFVPNIKIGNNGTMVMTSNVASKTDGTMGAINIMNAAKGYGPGTLAPSENGLDDVGGLPLRVVPVQLSLTTFGVPIAQLYQTFFIDFNTGTTVDNLYNCTQLTHTISSGKFTTSWTFAYNNGYGKFGAAPTINAVTTGILKNVVEDVLKTAKK